jgi:hypothetical protein
MQLSSSSYLSLRPYAMLHLSQRLLRHSQNNLTLHPTPPPHPLLKTAPPSLFYCSTIHCMPSNSSSSRELPRPSIPPQQKQTRCPKDRTTSNSTDECRQASACRRKLAPTTVTRMPVVSSSECRWRYPMQSSVSHKRMCLTHLKVPMSPPIIKTALPLI